jgi:predicted RNase H-like HicB family nuclease
MKIKIIIEQDEDKWHAYCPILEDKGASTYGNTLDEAFKNIKEVLAMTLASMKQHKKDDLDRFKENAMKDPEVKQKYEKLEKEYEKLRDELPRKLWRKGT